LEPTGLSYGNRPTPSLVLIITKLSRRV